MNAKPMCTGIPHRFAAFNEAVCQFLFCAKIVQILFGSRGGALAQPAKASRTINANRALITGNINACLLQEC